MNMLVGFQSFPGFGHIRSHGGTPFSIKSAHRAAEDTGTCKRQCLWKGKRTFSDNFFNFICPFTFGSLHIYVNTQSTGIVIRIRRVQE
jgi:hypothetical protein